MGEQHVPRAPPAHLGSSVVRLSTHEPSSGCPRRWGQKAGDLSINPSESRGGRAGPVFLPQSLLSVGPLLDMVSSLKVHDRGAADRPAVSAAQLAGVVRDGSRWVASVLSTPHDPRIPGSRHRRSAAGSGMATGIDPRASFRVTDNCFFLSTGNQNRVHLQNSSQDGGGEDRRVPPWLGPPLRAWDGLSHGCTCQKSSALTDCPLWRWPRHRVQGQNEA